jgi:multiple sugar transport system permease protein
MTNRSQRRAPYLTGDRIQRLAIHLCLIIGAITFLLPLIWVLSTSLKEPGDVYQFPPQFIPDPIRWQNYPDALGALPFDRFFINTLMLAVLRLIGLLITCSMAGFAFARLRWRGRRILFLVVLITLMIPSEVTIIPEYIIFSRLGWVGTFAPLIVPAYFATNAFFVFLFRQFFMGISQDIIDAARIDGCTFWQLYWRIVVPMSRPVFMVVTIYVIQNNWNAYLQPLIYLINREQYTLALGLRLFNEQYFSQFNLLMAAAVVVTLPILVMYFFMQRYFMRGVVFTGVKG